MTPREHDGPDHLFALLEQAGRGFRAEFGDVLSEQGVALPLSGSRMRVLQLIPVAGVRPTELAERARMTKQSLGEALTALEHEGLVARAPDPSDRRAWIVAPTSKGLAVSATVDRVARNAERRITRRLGRDDVAAFRRVLSALAERA
ncbi:MAG: MarR family winged helix-turn-helix transcriptional regulator [Candidatus Nanopelagicales bacterium]